MYPIHCHPKVPLSTDYTCWQSRIVRTGALSHPLSPKSTTDHTCWQSRIVRTGTVPHPLSPQSTTVHWSHPLAKQDSSHITSWLAISNHFHTISSLFQSTINVCVWVCVCARVCVCVRERERQTEWEKEREWEKALYHVKLWSCCNLFLLSQSVDHQKAWAEWLKSEQPSALQSNHLLSCTQTQPSKKESKKDSKTCTEAINLKKEVWIWA